MTKKNYENVLAALSSSFFLQQKNHKTIISPKEQNKRNLFTNKLFSQNKLLSPKTFITRNFI